MELIRENFFVDRASRARAGMIANPGIGRMAYVAPPEPPSGPVERGIRCLAFFLVLASIGVGGMILGLVIATRPG